MLKWILAKLDRGRPFTWDDFRLLDWKQRVYVKGNISAFGWWYGLRYSVTLLSPILNTVLNYRVRGMYLAFVDEDGIEIDPFALETLVCATAKKEHQL